MAIIKKTQLLNLISSDRMSQAIDLLQDATRNDQHLHDQVIQLAGRYNRLEREQIQGTVSKPDMDVENNRISSALTSLARQLPENIDLTIPFDGTLVYSDENDNTLPNNNSFSTPTESKETPTPPTSTRNAVIIGIASLGVILLAVLFVPCPTSTQYIVFRIILALGAAGVASIVPGLFSFNNTMLTASGALGVFGLVYLVNPAKSFSSEDGCNGLFDYTIFVESPNETLEFTGPAYLALRLEREYSKTSIGEDKTVNYKDIPAQLRNQTVLVELEAAGWQFLNGSNRDSIQLTGKSDIVQIQRDNSLCCVTGEVMDNTGKPIPAAIVSIQDLTTTTDSLGRFKLEIPKTRQKDQQPLKVRKNGYQVWDLVVRPGFQQVQLEREKKQNTPS